MGIQITFKREKETKNTYRYQEVVPEGEKPAIKYLYVDQKVINDLGNPENLEVTLEASE